MIHDMSARQRAWEQTRSDIIDAAARLVASEHPAAVTVPAVAAEAGVSVRTVYRHYPTKAALLDATSRRFLVRAGSSQVPTSTGELADNLHRMWKTFDDDREAVRAEHRSDAGADLRARRLPRSRAVVRDIVATHVPDLSPPERDRLADLVVALASSSMYLELVDRLGWTSDDAAATVEWAIDSLLAAAGSNPTVGTS